LASGVFEPRQYEEVGMAIRAWPAGPARRKNVGRARIVSPQACAGSARIGPRPTRVSPRPAGRPASPHKI